MKRQWVLHTWNGDVKSWIWKLFAKISWPITKFCILLQAWENEKGVKKNTKNEWKKKGWIKKNVTTEHFYLRYNEDKMTIVSTKLCNKHLTYNKVLHQEGEGEREKKKKKVESGWRNCCNFSLKLMTKFKAWEGEQANMGKYLGILEHIPTSVGKWIPIEISGHFGTWSPVLFQNLEIKVYNVQFGHH